MFRKRVPSRKEEAGGGSTANINIYVKKLMNSNFYLNFPKFITLYDYKI